MVLVNKKNLSIAMDGDQLNILDELNKELNKISFKPPNRPETVRYAIKFTKENLNTLELVKALEVELEEVKQENDTLRNLLIEFQNKINNVVR